MSCPFYTFRQNDYYCSKNSNYVNSDTYYKYCRNYDYDDCPVYKRNDSTSGCYLTTIVCSVLNKEDDNKVLNSLRNFRDNTLQKNKEYYDILKSYDIVGPIISESINLDKDRFIMSNYLYEKFLKPISKLIEEKKDIEAIERYKIMTLALINYYGIKKIYNNIDYNIPNFNPKTSGHGKKLALY